MFLREGSWICAILTDVTPYETDSDSLAFPERDKFPLRKYYPSPGKYAKLPQLSMFLGWGCFWVQPTRETDALALSGECGAELYALHERFSPLLGRYCRRV